MQSKEKFKITVREISDLAFSNAINKLRSEITKNPDIRKWNEKLRSKFKHFVHDGFKGAQLKLVEEISNYQKVLIENKAKLKQARITKDKTSEKDHRNQINEIENRLKILFHIGDGIAWQLFGAQVYRIRRFYINESQKTLDESNIKHALEIASVINKNPDDFALITDITNFIQISDLIVLKDNQLGILELKEGKINDELIKLKKDLFAAGKVEEKIKEIGGNLNPKMLEQFFRMIRQEIRMIQTVEVLNKDKGTDVKTGKEIKILNPKHITETYSNKIAETFSKLKDQNWAYDIDSGGIIHIGVYKPEAYILSTVAIPSLLNECKFKVIIDFSSIQKNLSEPLFAKPFPPEVISDLLFDDIRIILGFDLDKFFNDFEHFFKVKTKVLSRKETMKLKEIDKVNSKNIFEIKNQAFELTDIETGNSMILGGGIISKLIYDNISPLTLYLNMKETLQTNLNQ
ncbi:hypothetical protein [Flavobacterium hercynium]|uniref:Uncharacterized protein n=1 Tax=Flavobacterium hercynium TaxID=387094 RepID=A0A226GVS6_9FLAO|nr:hypothetical protein [Flavobacterium hercynium]OXA85536.1 hypothetical protein B0A66_19455 [Flavobacterium hercynium]SMP33397.1 hypothetical protein SAMN06265346_11690 [Flavobacterium hercynium]